MPIPFTCPHCHAQTMVEDQYAGQTGPCASCGRQITIPVQAGRPATYAPPPRKSGGLTAVVVVVVAVVVLLAGGALLGVFFVARSVRTAAESAMVSARGAAEQSTCGNNLRQIGMGMHNYHDTYRSMPAAVLTDQDGRPMRSWRVAILPFVEEQYRYDQYDFNEPWDSPTNQSIESPMPAVYRCPSDDLSGPLQTSYLMIAQEETEEERVQTFGGPPNQGVKIADVTDGTSNTILVVETAGLGIHWMEPRDLTFEEIEASGFAINDPSGNGVQGNHPGGVNVLMGDGTVRFVSETIDPDVLRGLLTVDGGEPAAPY